MDILNFIFPRNCFGCKRQGHYVCKKCLEEIRPIKQICPHCLKFSPYGTTHQKCQKKTVLSGLVTLWPYQGAIRKAILGLKYRFALEIAKELAQHSVKKIKEENYFSEPENITLIPIPSHRSRRNWRGFNQVEEIGKRIAKEMKWEYNPNLIKRKGQTKPQTELKGKRKRRKNVKGVFALNSNNIQTPSNKIYLVFDDVWTTGSTMKEASKVIKETERATAFGLVIAR